MTRPPLSFGSRGSRAVRARIVEPEPCEITEGRGPVRHCVCDTAFCRTRSGRRVPTRRPDADSARLRLVRRSPALHRPRSARRGHVQSLMPQNSSRPNRRAPSRAIGWSERVRRGPAEPGRDGVAAAASRPRAAVRVGERNAVASPRAEGRRPGEPPRQAGPAVQPPGVRAPAAAGPGPRGAAGARQDARAQGAPGSSLAPVPGRGAGQTGRARPAGTSSDGPRFATSPRSSASRSGPPRSGASRSGPPARRRTTRSPRRGAQPGRAAGAAAPDEVVGQRGPPGRPGRGQARQRGRAARRRRSTRGSAGAERLGPRLRRRGHATTGHPNGRTTTPPRRRGRSRSRRAATAAGTAAPATASAAEAIAALRAAAPCPRRSPPRSATPPTSPPPATRSTWSIGRSRPTAPTNAGPLPRCAAGHQAGGRRGPQRGRRA